MLTLQGYQVRKPIVNEHHIKGLLTVRPFIPSVFVKPQYVSRFPVFRESDQFLYVPKHFGVEHFGPIANSQRTVSQTPDHYWTFAGQLRPTQQNVVDSFLKPTPHDGILSLQTGGGKTVCGLFIASQLKLPTLILVHTSFLKDQWIDRITTFLPSARIGSIQGEVIDVDTKDIVVAMLQTVSMKDIPPAVFSRFGLVIVDECHHIASEVFSNAISKTTSTYMLGLSATPDRKDKLMHVIHWALGPILYQSNASDKMDTSVDVEVYEFEPPDSSFNEVILNHAGVMSTAHMINKVVQYAPRNEMIVSIIEDIQEPERQILVMTDRVDHVKALYENLPPAVKATAGCLTRGMKVADREELCKTKSILISTYQLLGEGFDLDTLNAIVLATSRPSVEQVIGRILRSNKTKKLIVDIVDPAFRRQFQERLRLYKERHYNICFMKLKNG